MESEHPLAKAFEWHMTQDGKLGRVVFSFDLEDMPTEGCVRSFVAAITAQPAQVADQWRDVATAPKDGTIIWALFRRDIFPGLRPYRDDLRPWNGVQVPLRHPGIYPDRDGEPFDMGWNIAAPVGNGGFPDEWIVGWMPLPAPPTKEQEG